MALADIIIVLEDGKITETGSPSYLMAKDGFVTKLGLRSSETEVHKIATETVVADQGKERASVLEEDEHRSSSKWRKNGDLSVYRYYLRCSSYTAVALYAAFMTCWMFCTEFLSTSTRDQMLPRLTNKRSCLAEVVVRGE